jgi:hypothetical protein
MPVSSCFVSILISSTRTNSGLKRKAVEIEWADLPSLKLCICAPERKFDLSSDAS